MHLLEQNFNVIQWLVFILLVFYHIRCKKDTMKIEKKSSDSMEAEALGLIMLWNYERQHRKQ